MTIFSSEYFASLAGVGLICAGAVWGARRLPGAWTQPVARCFAVLLVANFASWYVVEHDSLSMRLSLPLGLCDVATLVAAAALWGRWMPLVELTYFWGLGGTLQALLTPELFGHFPSYVYFQYYINHGGIVVAALFLVVGLRIVPRRGAGLRVISITAALVLVVAGIDRVTGGDYLYLAQRPPTVSVLNLLGPWPWYVGGMIGLGIAVIFLLDVPLRVARSRQLDISRASQGPAPAAG